MKTKELLEDYFHLFGVIKATEHYNGTFTTYMIWTTNKPDLDGLDDYESLSLIRKGADWLVTLIEY